VQVKEILLKSEITFSLEFFPPKTEPGWDKLFRTIEVLKPLRPSWVSVTCGAGGSSSRANTLKLVLRIKKETGLTVVSHITCVGSGRQEIAESLDRCVESNIENVLALRGDPPKDSQWNIPADGFSHASDLVRFIKREYPSMCIGVAGFPEGHPETPNRLKEMDFLKAKVDQGADYIITQLFFENRDFFDFCERCELAGIKVPILPGIMPVLSREGMHRISDVASGSRIPAGIIRGVASAADDDTVRSFGIEWAAKQVSDLLEDGARGIHFYTLNTARATLKICEMNGIGGTDDIHAILERIHAIHGNRTGRR
jgi:methylenetetrahydrofolate reductase (NADPH)